LDNEKDTAEKEKTETAAGKEENQEEIKTKSCRRKGIGGRRRKGGSARKKQKLKRPEADKTAEKLKPKAPKPEKAEAERGEKKEETAEDSAGNKEEAGDEEEDEKKSRFGHKQKKEKKELEKKDEQIASLTDRLQRSMAEFDNYRKRTEKEKSSMYGMGARDVVEKILPVVDNFERGFTQVTDDDKEDPFVLGMEKIYKQFQTASDRSRGHPDRCGRKAI
jgi:molecular chaperone GrpE